MRVSVYLFITFFLSLVLSHTSFAQEKKKVQTNNTVYRNPKTKNFTLSQFPRKDTVIVKGSEVKFSYRFSKEITYLELVGVGRASRTDIKAGKWEVTVKPTKSTIYCTEYIFDGLRIKSNSITGTLVIVVDSEVEAEKARKKLREVKENPNRPNDYKLQFI